MKCLAVLYALCLSVTPILAAPVGTAAPVTASLTIKAGDSLDIQVAGEAGLSKTYTVDANGQITMDLIGSVRVAGRTPDQVTQELRTRLSQYLTRPMVIVSPNTPVRQEIGVTVTGAVEHAGMMKLHPGDRLLDALGAAGSINSTADTEHALLVRHGASQPLPLKLDLLLKGDLAQNLLLEDGDLLQVPRKELATFQILGEVKLPGTRPIDKPIRVLDALVAAGGPTPQADLNQVILTHKGQQPITIDMDKLRLGEASVNVLIQPDDVLSVASGVLVQVGGEVKTPGLRMMRNGGTLKEAVELSGGLNVDADRDHVLVTHRDGTTETVSLPDGNAPIGGPVLRAADAVVVQRVKLRFVSVQGAVQKQGLMPYREGLKITEALMAAQLQESAKWKEVRVIRGDDGPKREIFKFNLEEYLKNPQTTNLALQPGDQIFVATQPRGGMSLFQRLMQVVPLASLFFTATR
jgi:polysaccharide export outer membrane protein